MADENVTIKIDTKADTRGVDKVRRRLTALSAQAAATNTQLNNMGNSLGSNNKQINQANQRLGQLNSSLVSLRRVGSAAANIFGKTFKLAMIGTAIETAALALALSSVNGFLITGRVLARAYQATIRGLGVAAANTAASVGVLVATFTAAMRQFSAAQASAQYGGSFAASSAALRTMQTDAELAVFGLRSVTAAFSAASRNTQVTAGTVAAIRGLSDFAIASGDMEKGLTAAAELVSLLESGKKVGEISVLEAAERLGPQFEEAFKKATAGGKRTAAEILSMFREGQLSATAGIAGTTENVRGSLLGQLKEFAVDIQTTFADIGMNFIKPLTETFNELRRIFFRTTVEVAGSLSGFAKGPFSNVIVKATDSLASFTSKIINEYLPKTEEVFNNFINGWNRMTYATRTFFNRFELFLEKYTDASKIINTFFGEIFKAGFGEAIGRNFASFSQLLRDNEEEFLDFGEAIGELIRSIGDLFAELRESFFKALPAINAITGAVTDLVNTLIGLVNVLQNLGTFGALLSLFLPLAAGRKTMTPAGRRRPGALTVVKRLGIGAGIAGAGALGSMTDAGMNVLMGTAIAGFVGSKAVPLLAGTQRGGRLLNSLATAQALSGRRGLNPLAMAGNVPAPLAGARAGRPGLGGALAFAAPAAGIMATAEMAGFLENRYGSTAATMGGSAATGAAAGAVVGSMFPVVGTLLGALAGTVIGGLIGGFTAESGRKKTMQAGADFAKMYAGNVGELLQAGLLSEANEAIKKFPDVAEEISESFGREGDFLYKSQAAALNTFDEEVTKLRPNIEQLSRNYKDLTRITGLTEQEIRELAQTAKIDLTSNFMGLNEILEVTGVAVRRVNEQFNALIAEGFARGAASMRDYFDVINAPIVMDEAAEQLRVLSQSGSITDADRVRFFETLALQAQTMFEGDTVAAFRYILSNIGPGGSQFGPGAVFEGLESAVLGDGELLRRLISPIEESGRIGVAENIVNILAGQGLQIGTPQQVEQMLLSAGFEGMRLADLMEEARGPGFLSTDAEKRLSEIFGAQINVQQTENSKFSGAVEGLGLRIITFEEAVAQFNSAVLQFAQSVGGTATAPISPRSGSGSGQAPLPPSTAAGAWDARAAAVRDAFFPSGQIEFVGDTSSQKRNLVNSLSSHRQFDMAIAGSRTVTSGLRFTQLGSMASDHAAGRAYDLIGNNLGLYKSSVLNAGGYADFHGAGASRHLHVVPPEGPVGDTASPVLVSSMSGGSGSTEVNYNIVVNAAQGMNEESVAELVMMKIERQQRMNAERR